MQIDNTDDPLKVKEEAEKQGIICISAMNGDGLDEFCNAIQSKLKVRFVLALDICLMCCFFKFIWNDLFLSFFSTGLAGAHRSFCSV
jgi:hypothetical protein